MIRIDFTSDHRFIYQQIYSQLRKQILQNELRAHSKLPSKRELAEILNVSINSVKTAYEQLMEEGYIYTVERVGYYVEEIQEFTLAGNTHEPFPPDLKEKTETRKGWLSLSHMNTNPQLFPFKKWLSCQAKIYDTYISSIGEMPHSQGPYILRQSIAEMLYRTRGITCEPEQIVLHGTSQGLLERLIYLQRESTFATENPGYARYHHLLKRFKINTHLVQLDINGIDVEYLTKTDANIVITTPSHQFPTGIIMPISRRIELLNWAAASEDRYIIEDDYDSEYKYQTDNIPALQSLDFNQKVIYMGTFSKTLLPGIRISYMVLPPKWLSLYKEHFALEIQPANILSLYTLQEFIDSGLLEKHVRKMTKHYETIRTLLIQQLQEQLGESIIIHDIPAGLHFLVEVLTEKSYTTIEEQAVLHKLELYTLKRFSLNTLPLIKKNRSIIIGFANIAPEDIPSAVERLKKVLLH
ncbi:MAG TPA: PLP-dependent aminotransferase family protein [Ureibacillus sp.]|nr:PLP-dependent aminotransferase family protein [Ureibacillus sp.]